MLNDDFYMKRAIELAKKGMGSTKANPLVGCVIVKNDEIIGEGYHERFGENHAEINAILNAKERNNFLEGATLYVNLEPCSHFGKTPPCANRIVEEKIKRVVIGTLDPFDKVAGRGVEILEKNNISVSKGILEEECLSLNERFFTYVEKNRPYVVLKSAMTIDGKIATSTGESKWITSEHSRRFSHELRGKLDAIMVGINTVLSDDPTLNVRYGAYKNNPIRVIVDSKLKIPEKANVLREDLGSISIIATTKMHDRENYKILKNKKNVEILICEDKDGQVNLEDAMQKLKKFDISSILLEGGATLNASMLKENLVDKFYFFIAPMIIGSTGLSAIGDLKLAKLSDAIKIRDIKTEIISGDILVTGRCD
ncbi:MAG: bifunctional diaminohydroxyphosphoribosylaminopyrimidine deaminase/5-amino-6-(5-phosphoribosylamino)uracil reductase RibD [Peptoniphilus sp.]|nr:bifunctional diaminohydroxyphosphoribosylaminopyrimidine deaminase/5-amino-6-(5-phosphoribosylamino)uracil reductase RibD [Peptoniphilus sp.]